MRFVPCWEFVQEHYRKYGKPTSEVPSIKRALTPLLKLYGRRSGRTFGPLALKACRQRMIEDGLTRGVINNHIGRAKRFFKWAAENELVPPEVYHGLQTVSGLRRGRSPAPESEPVRPVPDEWIDAVLKHVNRHIAAMIQLQRFTGMRPGEVIMMRACDLDTTGKVWLYRPRTHKTEHHDRERLICLGPRAQEVVQPFLVDDLKTYLFSPKLAMAERRANLRAIRKTPLTPSQRRRRPKRNPQKRPGECYTIGSYEHAINRGCDKAFPPPRKLTEGLFSAVRRHLSSMRQISRFERSGFSGIGVVRPLVRRGVEVGHTRHHRIAPLAVEVFSAPSWEATLKPREGTPRRSVGPHSAIKDRAVRWVVTRNDVVKRFHVQLLNQGLNSEALARRERWWAATQERALLSMKAVETVTLFQHARPAAATRT